ncbi:MAG: hypothetical protein S4CHLAM6_09960 [Chlamydiae bacterium]|nr:hypothetical protein [Chlamydiota bacterium]
MAAIDCLIPVYNNEAYLKECIESILSQTFQDFHIILYDSASTDGSVEIIEKFMTNEKRVSLIRGKENKGVAHSLNNLLKQSKAKYIAWQMPDDLSHPNRFERQIERLKNSSLVCVGTSIVWDGSLIGVEAKDIIAPENPRDILYQQIGSSSHRGLFLETAMYERKLLKEMTPFDENLPIKYDLLFNTEVQIKYPLRLANLKETLYTMRIFPGCTQEKESNGEITIDTKSIAEAFVPALFFIKHKFIDNILITRAFLPY